MGSEAIAGDWKTLGTLSGDAGLAARLELHHAAQIVSAVGATLLEPAPDDSHPNLGWDTEGRAFVGRQVPGEPAFRGALRLPELELGLERADGTVVARFPLAGTTCEQALDALGEAITRLGVDLPGAGLERPRYELPDHPVAKAAPFGAATNAHGQALEQLARWYENAQRALEALAARTPGASEVRCWPHHFDLATLVTLDTGPDGAATRTVGVGMSPGDETHPEPYWYVSPWPYPQVSAAELPPLPHGAVWHTDGYTAAIWTATQHVASGPDDRQAERLDEFLDAAVQASRGLAGRTRG